MTSPAGDLASDATLLTRWRSGDERAATEKFVHEYGMPAMCRVMLNANDVFITLVRAGMSCDTATDGIDALAHVSAVHYTVVLTDLDQDRVDKVVAKRGYRQGFNWMTRSFPGQKHNEISWASRVADHV